MNVCICIVCMGKFSAMYIHVYLSILEQIFIDEARGKSDIY